MRLSVINVLEMIIGIILFGLGLLYLTSQDLAVNKLTDTVNNVILDKDELYQQYSNIDGNHVSDEELYTIIMGCREYPIMIDNVEIATDDNDYEDDISLIKAGYYKKQYEYNSEDDIVKIIYTYVGT